MAKRFVTKDGDVFSTNKMIGTPYPIPLNIHVPDELNIEKPIYQYTDTGKIAVLIGEFSHHQLQYEPYEFAVELGTNLAMILDLVNIEDVPEVIKPELNPARKTVYTPINAPKVESKKITKSPMKISIQAVLGYEKY